MTYLCENVTSALAANSRRLELVESRHSLDSLKIAHTLCAAVALVWSFYARVAVLRASQSAVVCVSVKCDRNTQRHKEKHKLYNISITDFETVSVSLPPLLSVSSSHCDCDCHCECASESEADCVLVSSSEPWFGS